VGQPLDLDPPVRARRAAPLTRREKAWVAVAAVTPVALTVAILAPVAAFTALGGADVAEAALVYGGLLGLAAGFVATDRLQARQCPRCRTRHPHRPTGRCGACGYDLDDRPRFTCSERHLAYVDDDGDGRCACGRRLERLPTARGIGPQVVATLKIGAWLLAFLLAMGVLLRWFEGGL
jgi:ribosomal protein L37E